LLLVWLALFPENPLLLLLAFSSANDQYMFPLCSGRPFQRAICFHCEYPFIARFSLSLGYSLFACLPTTFSYTRGNQGHLKEAIEIVKSPVDEKKPIRERGKAHLCLTLGKKAEARLSHRLGGVGKSG
jgi:hypothetical protein